MADTDTAVLDKPDTTEADPTPADAEQDTDGQAQVDTEGDEDGDTGDDEPTLLTPEQAEELAQSKVTEALAQAKADQDDRAQADNYRATLQRSAQTLNQTAAGQLHNVISYVLDRAEAGDSTEAIRKALAPRAINDIAFALGEAAFTTQMDQISESFRAYVAKEAPEFKPSAELVRDLERAQRALPGDQPHAQALRRVTTEWKYLFEAAKEAALKEVRAEEAELNKKAAATKGLAKAGTNGQKPVSGGGAGRPGGRIFRTQLAVDTALSNNEIDWPTAKQWTAKGLPYS